MDELSFYMLAASTRHGSLNHMLIEHIRKWLGEHGYNRVTHQPYTDLECPPYHDQRYDASGLPEGAQALASQVLRHHAWIVALPEYNWSYPGSLKNLLDWISRINPVPLQHKPVLLASASPSLQGGVKGLLHFTTPLEALGAFVYPHFITVSDAHHAMDYNAIHAPRLLESTHHTLQGFVEFARRLSQPAFGEMAA